MLVASNINALFRDNGKNYLLKRGVLTSDCPSWVTESDFFRALVRDGHIAVTDSTSDAVVQKAVEEAAKKETEVKEQKVKKAAKKTTKKE